MWQEGATNKSPAVSVEQLVEDANAYYPGEDDQTLARMMDMGAESQASGL